MKIIKITYTSVNYDCQPKTIANFDHSVFDKISPNQWFGILLTLLHGMATAVINQ